MKKIVVIFCFVLGISSSINSQWFSHNIGTNDGVSRLFFIDETKGFLIAGQVLYNTIDGGYNWNPIFQLDTLAIQSLFFLNPEIGWCTYQDFPNYSGGILKTNDGGLTWDFKMISGTEMNMGDILFLDSLRGWSLGIYSMAGGRLYKTTDGGETWSDTLTSVNLAGGLYFLNANVGWIAGGTINKTTNAGISWTQQLNIDPRYFNFIQFIDADTGWAFSRGYWLESLLYKTTNGGQTWFLQSDFHFNHIKFVDGQRGWALKDSSIYVTKDGGANWELQFVSNQFLYEIFFVNKNYGWVVGENGNILITNNGGIPVELISFSADVNLNGVSLTWATATETNNQGFEIQRSEDSKIEKLQEWEIVGFVSGNGTTTEPQSYSFIDENLSASKYQYRLKQIDFDGTFEYSSTIEVEVNSPTKFSLEQNYPNPFNPSTKISWQSPVISWQTLKVYDILGNEIATLVNEEKSAGQYEVEFNPESSIKNPASGIYFYQLKAGDFVETKKMILMK